MADPGSAFTYMTLLPADALHAAFPTAVAASHGSIIRSEYDATSSDVLVVVGGSTVFSDTSDVETVVMLWSSGNASRAFNTPVVLGPITVRVGCCDTWGLWWTVLLPR